MSSSSEIKKAFGINARRVQARLDDIAASPNLAILMQLPAANCHALTGSRQGEWAVSISPNHRMVFEIANDPVPTDEADHINAIKVTDIRIKTTTDYH